MASGRPDQRGGARHGDGVLVDQGGEGAEEGVGQVVHEVRLPGLLSHERTALGVVHAFGTVGESGRRLEAEQPEGDVPGLLPVSFRVHQGPVAVEDDGGRGPRKDVASCHVTAVLRGCAERFGARAQVGAGMWLIHSRNSEGRTHSHGCRSRVHVLRASRRARTGAFSRSWKHRAHYVISASSISAITNSSAWKCLDLEWPGLASGVTAGVERREN